MGQRSLIELLELMLKNQKLFYGNSFTGGLCNWIYKLFEKNIITSAEYSLLFKYIQNNRPAYKWYNIYMMFNSNNNFYWRKGLLTPRVNWIQEHINLNKYILGIPKTS